jgi:hypothetical protein
MIKYSDDTNTVVVDRNKAIQFIIDEFTIGNRLLLFGDRSEWEDYWQHWKAIYKEVEENRLGVPVGRWKRSGDDHFVHATVYWRTGIHRFGGDAGGFIGGKDPQIKMHSGSDGEGNIIMRAEM